MGTAPAASTIAVSAHLSNSLAREKAVVVAAVAKVVGGAKEHLLFLFSGNFSIKMWRYFLKRVNLQPVVSLLGYGISAGTCSSAAVCMQRVFHSPASSRTRAAHCAQLWQRLFHKENGNPYVGFFFIKVRH